jgi:hypothetical protein
VSWCKGHANQSHIDQGRTTPFLKLGNDIADANATRGVEGQVDGVLQLAGYYAAKHKQYLDFVIRIHAMFLRVLRAEKAKIEEDDAASKGLGKIIKGTDCDSVIVPVVFDSPQMTEGTQLELDRITLSGLPAAKAEYIYMIWTFLKVARWKPTEQGDNGNSWIELFCRYAAMGGLVDFRDQAATSFRPQQSFKNRSIILRSPVSLSFGSMAARVTDSFFSLPEIAEEGL